MPPTASAATCPNCNLPVRPGSDKCLKCKLEVAKFAAYSAAMQAAQKRGIKKVAVETGPRTPWINPVAAVKWGMLLLFVGVVVFLGYHWFGPKPPRYLKFPDTAEKAATQLMKNINGDESAFDQAYFLVADSARSAQVDDDRGDYMQMFHILNAYLSSEFGSDWFTQTTFAPDPADPNLIIAKVSAETIHIHTAQQTPPDQLQKQGSHFAITAIDELDLTYAPDLRRDAFVHDAFNFAGKAATSDWEAIIGATASNRHYPPFIKKMLILQALRNPRSANWKAVVQADPFRTDPVIQARLQSICTDERYDVAVRNTAKEVIDDKVTEEEKAAVGL